MSLRTSCWRKTIERILVIEKEQNLCRKEAKRLALGPDLKGGASARKGGKGCTLQLSEKGRKGGKTRKKKWK